MSEDRLSKIDRREFVARIGVAAAAISMGFVKYKTAFASAGVSPDIRLPPLPYAENALEPYISEKIISFHYGKHHQGYVNKTLSMVSGTEFENASLEEIIKETAGRSDKVALFNNAAQVYNHTFYWNSMKPGAGGEPQGRIAREIRQSFGDYGKFIEAFSNAAATQFGSGWAWLVQDGEGLKVVQTSNADTPITKGMKPLITIDVWEHAYYLDYQNRRSDYIKAFVESLLNWDFADRNLA